METSKLMAALREETLPRMAAAREALERARQGDTSEVPVIREVFHRIAGTAAVAGLPGLSKLAHLGELVALATLEGEAQPGPRLCGAMGELFDAIESDLVASTQAVERPTERGGSGESRGRILVASDEAVSAKLLLRFLEDSGFETRRLSLADAARALPDGDALLLDLPGTGDSRSAIDAVLAAAALRHLPVLLTGRKELAPDGIASRVATFLAKPVVPEELETAARSLVARHRAISSARARAPTSQLPSPVSARRRALKVMVVDDSRVIRGVVREALAEVGITAVEAEDGASALTLFDAEQPDAVISDVQMPGLDGAQLTRVLREKSKTRVPIVVLSALEDEASRRAGLAAGADAYLVKSVIDGPALLKALQEAGLSIALGLPAAGKR